MIDREANRYQRMVNYNINPNTLNYDLSYQRLELNLDPAVYNVSGTVTSHFTPKEHLSAIYFDFTNNLPVSSVKYHGVPVEFEQLATKELKVKFNSDLPPNIKDSLSISYSGAPDSANDAFTITKQGGTPVLFTLSEPYGAQDWFPTKQSMNDKIEKIDIKITAPSQYSVAANGRLVSESTQPNGSKVTWWQTNYPTAAYLIGLGITNYIKVNSTIGSTNPFPYLNYIYPSANNAGNLSNIEWLKSAMTIFENYFGPYPFRNEKYGHLQFGYGGGMEHQTVSSVGSFGQGLLAHELAHQWFGDKLTCGTWNDIWLNEGFATYGEHLVNEKLLMTNAQFLSYLKGQITTITSSPNGSVYVSDNNLSNINAVFSSRLSYAKGAYVLRMMKWILGDEAFYKAVKDYDSRPDLSYSYTRTADLISSFKQSTGKDFTEFVNDWVYGQGYPTYNIRWKNANNTITFAIGQTQSHSSVSFYEMPLPIKVTGTNNEVAYFILDNTSNNQYFTLPLAFKAATVAFNYDYQILEKNSSVVNDNNLYTNEVNATKLRLYPNPAKSTLCVSGVPANHKFAIYSAAGALVKEGTFPENGQIDISKLPKSDYILKLGESSLKFIKE